MKSSFKDKIKNKKTIFIILFIVITLIRFLISFNLSLNTPIICQKRSYLASEEGVEECNHFQKRIGTGLFGGEGFIMQKLSGSGTAFIEIDGSTVEYQLKPGQQMLIDTGYLAMMDATVKMEIKRVSGVKNALFGGEGIFNTLVTGPGRIVLQTMPISTFAAMVASMSTSRR